MAKVRMAGWQMPSVKQMEKMAAEAERRPVTIPNPAPADPVPDALWNALLDDPRAGGKPKLPIPQCRLADIQRHVLRTACARCPRIVEIQKADAVRFYGPNALWKDVSQRLLDRTCTNRTGRQEKDGCWPKWTH